MLKHSATRLLLASSAILVSIVACSSPDTGGSTGTATSKSTSGSGANGNGGTNNGGGGNTNGGNTGGGDTGGNTGGNTGGTSPEGGAAASGDSACAAMATADACGTCCGTNHATGAKLLDDTYFSCLCGSGGACQTQCAKTDCSMDQNAPAPTPGDACDKCEQTNAPGDGTGKCDMQADTACNADTDCAALYKCYDSCPKQ